MFDLAIDYYAKKKLADEKALRLAQRIKWGLETPKQYSDKDAAVLGQVCEAMKRARQ